MDEAPTVCNQSHAKSYSLPWSMSQRSTTWFGFRPSTPSSLHDSASWQKEDAVAHILFALPQGNLLSTARGTVLVGFTGTPILNEVPVNGVLYVMVCYTFHARFADFMSI